MERIYGVMVIEHWLDSFLAASRPERGQTLPVPYARCYRRSWSDCDSATGYKPSTKNVGLAPNADLEAGHFEVLRFRRAASSARGLEGRANAAGVAELVVRRRRYCRRCRWL